MELDPFIPEYLEKYLVSNGLIGSGLIHLREAPARLEQGFVLITYRPVHRMRHQMNQSEFEVQISRPETDKLLLEKFNSSLSQHFADLTDIVFEGIDLGPTQHGLPDDFEWPAVCAFSSREATPPMILNTPKGGLYEAVVNLRFQFDLQELLT